jgi:hypothetical protein
MAIVEGFKAQKLRVLNMSWRYGVSAHECALTWHNGGALPEERKQMARKLFEIEREALRAAIASALFHFRQDGRGARPRR